MTLSLDLGDFIAAIAVAVSIWAIVQTGRFNRRQTRFESTAERLNQLLIDREASDNAAQRQADLSVRFFKLGKSSKLKVFNRGKSDARNVRIEDIGEAGLLMASDIERKFPVKIMEPHGYVDLIAVVHLASASSTHVRLTWDDGSGKGHSKELFPVR